jgi:hypothetical protein
MVIKNFNKNELQFVENILPRVNFKILKQNLLLIYLLKY